MLVNYILECQVFENFIRLLLYNIVDFKLHLPIIYDY